MKFQIPNSNKTINVDIVKYRIDWDRAVSKPQKAVKDFLYRYWKGKIILEEFKMPGMRYRFDLVNMNDHVIVEVSPKKVHGEFNKFFHKTRLGYVNSIKRDMFKIEWAEKNGFTLVEIFDDDIDVLSREWFREKYGVEL
jgi:hypothetical protein